MLRMLMNGYAALWLVALLTLAACSANDGPNQVNTKPFEGQRITFYAQDHPWTEAMSVELHEFEEETGIIVDLQTYPEEQLQNKLSNLLEAESMVPDVFTYRPFMEKLLYYKNGWTEQLNTYVNRNKDYHFEDFSRASVDGSLIGDQLYSIPLWTDQFVMYYRKDILELNGIAVPTTLDELAAAAEQLNDPANGFHGIVLRGERNALVSAVSSFVYSEGGDFIVNDKAALNTPEAVQGFQIYTDLLRKYGPEDVLEFGWPEASSLFAEGKAAFYLDAAALYSNTADPRKSIVADQVAFALFPAGSAGAKPYAIASWALAMNPKSHNKEAGWAFMEWATSKESVRRIQQSGVPGARDSVWSSQGGTSRFPADLAAVIKQTMDIGVDHSVPQVMNVTEARDVVGDIVVKAMLGEDIQAAADEANKKLQHIIDRELAE